MLEQFIISVQIILIDTLVLIGYYVWTQLNKIDVMKIYGIN